ncbi:hypothetical protein X798_05489 [Onchocerca flexuosa]|uniref:Uncharacterized protein n=1 Tax=Onchocerca flexuosa TaxID=387005 RepID=A0A238BS54_9BILA|nr:hypothetical protein X798_05489 [Onchocerca flexuosa]
MEIRSELLKACAKLVKRSVFDGHACDIDLLASRLYALLTDQEPEFNNGLLKIYSKCLHIVSRFCIFIGNLEFPSNSSMTEIFLRISSIIFERNFGIYQFSSKNDAIIRGPPKTWKVIFFWNEFLPLFFNLHRFLRNDSKLSLLSIGCLTQLTSIRDVILPDTLPSMDSEATSLPDIPLSTAYDKYISDFLAFFVTIFNSQATMPESVARAEASFPVFISFIPELTENFAKKKDEQEEGNVDAKVNEKGSLTDCSLGLKWAYISAIQHLFKGWLIVLQNSVFLEGVLGYTIDFAKITIVMISSFMQTMFSVPFGDRQEASLTLPDREIFKEIMIKIGSFSSYYLDQMLPKIFTILADILGEFLITMDTGMKEKNLNMWQENMHWILLDIGHILVEEDKNRNCVWQRKLLDYYDEISEEGNDNIDICASYIDACVNTPQILTDTSDINLIIKIIGTVFAWCSIEDDLLKEYGTTAVNPKLCSTSLWCAKRLISAIGLHIQTSDTYLTPVLKPSVNLLSTYKDSSAIVEAVLQFFDCLTKRMYFYCDNLNDMSLIYESIPILT